LRKLTRKWQVETEGPHNLSFHRSAAAPGEFFIIDIKMKNINDLKQKIGNFSDFSEFIKNNKLIISTGKLSEYYCKLLFDIRLNNKPNDLYDGVDAENKKVEIKQRKSISRIPGGMKIDLYIAS